MSDDIKKLNISMLGGFEMKYGETPVVPKESRSSKVVQLLAYLVYNRGAMLPQDELTEVILGGEENDNPAAVLKNIVYRARKMLEAAGMDKGAIAYGKNAYGFIYGAPCEVDIERFTALAEKIAKTKDDKRALALCLEAVDIYKGDFLVNMTSEPWVMGGIIRYQEIYFHCLAAAFDIVERTKGDYSLLLEPLQMAVKQHPYEEKLEIMYITVLFEMKLAKEAREEYDRATELLFNDLGVMPSNEMQELFKRITGGLQAVAESADCVRKSIEEEKRGLGAYFCDFMVFEDIYRFIVRQMERSGQSVFLMLCTLTEQNGMPPESGGKTDAVVSAFHEAVRVSCRSGDVYTRYSPSQFVLALIDIKQEDCSIVEYRLRSNFYKQPKMSKIRLAFKCISAIDVDNMVESGTKQW